MGNALTTMLYHTGTPSSQFMMVCATNRPGDLDSAVLNRLDESVEFGLPDVDARLSMINLYFDMFITKPLGIKPLKAAKPERADAVVEERPPAGPGSLRPPKQPAAKPAASHHPPTLSGEEVCSPDLVDQLHLADASHRLHGFSGREIAKLFTSLQTHVLFSHSQQSSSPKASPKSRGKKTTTFELSRSMFFEVVDQKVLEHDRAADFQVSGYNYQHTEKRQVPNGNKAARDSAEI